MRARSTALLTAAAVTLAAPAAADAASLQLNRACYLTGGVIDVTGAGFLPSSAVAITQDGAPIGTAQSDAAGGFRISFQAPDVPASQRQRALDIQATDGTATAAAAGLVTAFNADFSPSEGNPRTLKVRFSADGFNLLGGAPNTVYLHYVAPGGKLKRTVALGKATGPCGRLSTAKRKLFAFTARRGTWRLQWDTRRRYRRCTRESTFLCFAREVRVYRLP